MKRRQKGVALCGVDGCKHIQGYCDAHDFERQFGDAIVESVQSAGKMISDRIKRDVFGLDRAIEGACTMAILGGARHFAKHWDWLSCVPTPWLENKTLVNMLMFLNKGKLRRQYATRTCLLWGALSIPNIVSRRMKLRTPFSCIIGTVSLLTGITCQKMMIDHVKGNFEKQLLNRNTIEPMIQEMRDKHIGRVCKATAIVGVLYAISRIYRSWRTMKIQGSLEPTTEKEVKQRDSEDNVWGSVVPRPLPARVEASGATTSQLSSLVAKNLVYGTVKIDDKNYMVNGFFLKSNVVIVPDHYFLKDEIEVVFRKENPESCGGKFAVKLSKLQSYHIPNTDIRVCYSSSGGSFKDLTKYLPVNEVPMHEFELIWRGKEGVINSASGIATPCNTSNGDVDFRGLRYTTLSINTFKGLCGAILISKRKPLITGIHLGGHTGTPRGCAGVLELASVEPAIESLRSMEGVVISGSAEHFETQVLGVKVLTGKPLHFKSSLNYMPPESQVEYY